MTNNPNYKLSFGPDTAFDEQGDLQTPEWVEVLVVDVDYRIRFFWRAANGAYIDLEGNVLYIEPVDNDGTLDYDSYFEFPNMD